MPKNRLNLNFSLRTATDREAFITDYLTSIDFTPTSKELSLMGDYILWGEGGNEDGMIQIDTKKKTWTVSKEESLDALLEEPTFQEIVLSKNRPQLKIPKPCLSREKVERMAPDNLLPIFKDLWHRIDSLEVLIGFYDLAHNRRKSELREELIKNFTPEQLEEISGQSELLTQKRYLFNKHLIVELRKEQYALMDLFYSPRRRHTQETIAFKEIEFEIGENVEIYPFTLSQPSTRKFFPKSRLPGPQDFKEEELKLLTKLLWEKTKSQLYIDFTNPLHVSKMVKMFSKIDWESSELPDLLRTLNYYISISGLVPAHLKILEMKANGKTNLEIRELVNRKYNKAYNENYISTIFHKKIITSICEAAAYHREVLENLTFPEEFKTCSKCKQEKLRVGKNFSRKTKAKDGFNGSCKACNKKKEN